MTPIKITVLTPARINVRLLEKLKPLTRVSDTEARGLFAEAGSTGQIRFRFKGELREGPKTGTARAARTVKQTLGTYPEMSLEDARLKAGELRLTVQGGKDPRTGTARAPGMWTVDTLIQEYRKDLAKAGKAPRTIEDIGARYKSYLSEHWGALPVVSITGQMARGRHEFITDNGDGTSKKGKKDGGAVVANDTLRNFRAAYNWAMKTQAHLGLTSNPVDAVTFNLQRGRTESREFQLPSLKTWAANLALRPNPLRREMHMLALFSGLRPGSLVNIERGWLRLDQQVIVFPADAMKKRREFHLPLSKHMVEIVKRALAAGDVNFPGAPFLFPSRGNKARTGPIIATKVWKERGMASETGYILRHAYSNACHTTGVQDSDRMLLLGQAIQGIKGTYLHTPTLFHHLLLQQEKVTGYLLAAIAPAKTEAAPEAKPEKKVVKKTAKKRKKTGRKSAGSSRTR